VPVDVPRQVDPEHVRDRRQDVHVRRVAVVDAAAPLSGQLHEERDERDVREVPSRDVAARPAGQERLALVAGHDHERAVVDPGRA
jgi:hypothetical protein